MYCFCSFIINVLAYSHHTIQSSSFTPQEKGCPIFRLRNVYFQIYQKELVIWNLKFDLYIFRSIQFSKNNIAGISPTCNTGNLRWFDP